MSEFYGTRLTVICFWASRSPLAVWQLDDLSADVVEVYKSNGVQVVAINVKESASEVKSTLEKVEISYPVLLDEDGSGFSQVATTHLPRTYVLDAEGKILWFDLGYARETRRHLDQAIRYGLHNP